MLMWLVWGPPFEKLWSRRARVINKIISPPSGQKFILRGKKYLTSFMYKAQIYICYICGIKISCSLGEQLGKMSQMAREVGGTCDNEKQVEKHWPRMKNRCAVSGLKALSSSLKGSGLTTGSHWRTCPGWLVKDKALTRHSLDFTFSATK